MVGVRTGHCRVPSSAIRYGIKLPSAQLQTYVSAKSSAAEPCDHDPERTDPSVIITVDNPPPTTTVLLPSNGATVSGSEYLDARASANVTSVSFELSAGSLANPVIVSGSTITYYGWIGSWNTASVPDGTYTLRSVASYAGGVSGTSAPISFMVSTDFSTYFGPTRPSRAACPLLFPGASAAG